MHEVSSRTRLLLMVAAIIFTALAWGGVSIKELVESLHR
jgi:hypothetical protein